MKKLCTDIYEIYNLRNRVSPPLFNKISLFLPVLIKGIWQILKILTEVVLDEKGHGLSLCINDGSFQNQKLPFRIWIRN